MMKQKIINTIFNVVSAPLVLFEYLILFWFWGGADVFNLVLTPLTFITYLIGLMYFKRKMKVKDSLGLLFKIILAVSLPILTMVTVWFFALSFGIDIVIL